MIVQAFGVVDDSPLGISLVLRKLNMSHTVVGSSQMRHYQYDIDGLSMEQPVWPVIVDKVRNIQRVQQDRERLVYFVSDGRAALDFTNLNRELWPENRAVDLVESVRSSLLATCSIVQPWTLAVNEPHISDYVRAAVKPSFLNKIQSLFHKITPYAKSKETRNLCVAYLAGGIGIQVLRRYLKASLKLAPILEQMDSPAALNLRNAVLALKTKPLETVAEEFGVEHFEMLYVVKSYLQHKDDGKV
jgi:hypothetical protein